jgi:hypothetical protein
VRAITWFAVGLVIFGSLSLAGSWSHERRLAKVPRMTCDELVRKGPAADGFAMLTDLKACGRGYLMYRDPLCPGDVEMYVPAYAAHFQQEPQPSDLVLLLAIHDDDPLDCLMRANGPVEFTCQVDRNVDRLENWIRQGITAKYPGLQLANCWILNVGLHEPSSYVARRMLQTGLVTVLTGGGILIWLALRSGARQS